MRTTPPRSNTLSLHDALPILSAAKHLPSTSVHRERLLQGPCSHLRSEEHTSELQSRVDLVCRLLLEKKNRAHLPPHRHHRVRHVHGVLAPRAAAPPPGHPAAA